MSGVIVTYEIPLAQVQAVIQDEMKGLEQSLIKATEELLELTAQAQATSYTANANPSRPPGSEYRRTFSLQRASETRIISSRLPVISGVWRANEGKARYASSVIGSRADQAQVHRGRWKSLEEVAQEINEKAPDIVRKHTG